MWPQLQACPQTAADEELDTDLSNPTPVSHWGFWCGYKFTMRNWTCLSRCFTGYTGEYLNVFAIVCPTCAFFTNVWMADKCKDGPLLKAEQSLVPAAAGQIKCVWVRVHSTRHLPEACDRQECMAPGHACTSLLALGSSMVDRRWGFPSGRHG